MSIPRIFLIGLLCICTRVAFAATDDGFVGMVLDLQGSGQLVEKGSVTRLQLLSYVKPQMQLKLDAGSKVSLSLYATRSVYQLTGPSVVDIDKDRLTVRQGAAPVIKSMAEKLVAAAENTNIVHGAYRMRNLAPKIVLTTPENGSVLLNERPTFSWEASDVTGYDVTVEELQEHTIVAIAKVNDTSWQLPAKLKLEYGNNYRWSVSYPSAKEGKVISAAGDFSLASKADADKVSALKPEPKAAIEEWILYASMLQSQQMREEARAAWQFVAKRRPDLQKVQDLAR